MMTGTVARFADPNEHTSKSSRFCVTRAGLARLALPMRFARSSLVRETHVTQNRELPLRFTQKR